MRSIAFFDSGMGGLTVLKEAQNLLPNEHFIYFADTDHVPYGTKTKEEIIHLVQHAAQFLTQFSLKALVVACNTATSVAIKELRATYDFPIIGMEPAIKPAVQQNTSLKTMVSATELTLKEDKLHRLVQDLDAGAKVDFLSLQELVAFAEEFRFYHTEVWNYLEQTLKQVDWSQYDSLVLGCTHFIYFRKQLRYLLPHHVKLIDGNLGTIRHLKNQIHLEKSPHQTPIQYFQSGRKKEAIYFERYLNKNF